MSDSPAASPGRSAGRWLFPIAVMIAATAIAFLRISPAARRTLWAEDGRDFVADYLHDGFWATIFRPFGGYLQFLPRLLAAVSVQVSDLSHLAQVVTLLACLTVGLTGALIFVYSRQVLAGVIPRIVLGLIPTLTPTGPLEPLGTLNNLHSYVLLLAPWLFTFIPTRWWSAIASACVALAITLTETQVLFFLPLLLFGIRSKKKMLVVCATIGGLLAELATTVIAPRIPIDYGAHMTAWDAIVGYVLAALPASFTSNLAHVVHVYGAAGPWPFVGLAIVVGAYLAVAFALGDRRQRSVLAAIALASGITWCAALLVTPAPVFEFSQHPVDSVDQFVQYRYTSLASALILTSISMAAGLFLQRTAIWARASGVVGLAVVLGALILNFPTAMSARSFGESLASQVPAARLECSTGARSVILMEAPPGKWHLEVTCDYVGR